MSAIKVGKNGEKSVISMDEFLREKITVRKFNTNRNVWLTPYDENDKEKKMSEMKDMWDLGEVDDFERELKKLNEEIEEKNKKKNKNKKNKYCTVVIESENYKIYDWIENWCREKD